MVHFAGSSFDKLFSNDNYCGELLHEIPNCKYSIIKKVVQIQDEKHWKHWPNIPRSAFNKLVHEMNA
jgi:hypothetical protein